MSMDVASLSASTSSPQIWSGASARLPASQKMSNLFDQIDTGGSGSITQSQFDSAFQNLNPPKDFKGAGANAVWTQLDPSNTGSVSKQDFVSGMTSIMRQMRSEHHHGAGGTNGSAAQSPAQTIAASASSVQGLLGGSQIDITA